MRLSIFLVGVMCAAVAQAQIKIDMKPGLWENSVKITGEGMAQMQHLYSEQMKQAMEDMKKQMANMPPEQRKMMEDAMAASGMQVNEDSIGFQDNQVTISKDGTVAKQCVTQADIDKGQLPEMDENCKSTLTQLDKNRFKSTHACGGENPSTMEAEVVFHSSTHYTGQGTSRQVIHGKPVEMIVNMEGKWLASHCGDVKPEH